MSAAALLDRVHAAGGSLRVTDGKVIARHIPASLLPELRAHKAELMALMTTPANDAAVTRPVLKFLVLGENGGSLLGSIGDDVPELVNSLVDRYGNRLITVSHQDRIIWPSPE